MFRIDRIPLFQKLEESQNILIAGAGGGFDIFTGIPLYFNLKEQGKNVTIANFSFTSMNDTTSEQVYPFCYKIKGSDLDNSVRNYFPEKYLQQWFTQQGENVDVYAFERTGVIPLRDAYRHLIKEHNIDTIILVDGGTDSLMFGDEEGLGTPHEDVTSMAAVYRTGIEKQYLVSVGFGIDHYHGVSHFRFLENVAEIAKAEGYLGIFQITKEMDEAKKYESAINFVNEKMKGMESIVSNSIISALNGIYGNVHFSKRTEGSELWINPLMTIYWSFDLRRLVQKIKYYDAIKDSHSIGEFSHKLTEYRNTLSEFRNNKAIPI